MVNHDAERAVKNAQKVAELTQDPDHCNNVLLVMNDHCGRVSIIRKRNLNNLNSNPSGVICFSFDSKFHTPK